MLAVYSGNIPVYRRFPFLVISTPGPQCHRDVHDVWSDAHPGGETDAVDGVNHRAVAVSIDDLDRSVEVEMEPVRHSPGAVHNTFGNQVHVRTSLDMKFES
jgi:hypothetical protein